MENHKVAQALPVVPPVCQGFCQLMLHLMAEPKGVAEAPDPSRRESLFGLCMERARLIAGGSDADVWDQADGVSSRPPLKSNEIKRPEASSGADAAAEAPGR
jgi:hypothetical protein